MRDPVSIQRANKLHPKVVQEVFEAIGEAEAGFPINIQVRIVQGLRTIEEQDALYAQGRTLPGKVVTNAKGGSSYHNYGLAVDFAILYDKDGNGTFEELSWDTAKDFDKDRVFDWQEVVIAFEKRGWEWGGKWRTFKDLPHVQKTFGKTVKQLKELYKPGEYVPV